jgi:hypothetical protein
VKRSLLALLLFASTALWAAPVYVGSFNVYDGPVWNSNPNVLSALETAAMLFGGLPTDYAISVDPSLDPSTITHTAWLDGYGDETYLVTPAAEDYSLSSIGGGYNYYPSFSAWVCDHANCIDYGYPATSGLPGDNYTNYVWLLDTGVPEPSAWCMVSAGLGVLAMFGRKSRRKGIARQQL